MPPHATRQRLSQAVCTRSSVFALGCLNNALIYLHQGQLTNGSTMLWSMAVTVFLIGLVSEQITALTYRRDT